MADKTLLRVSQDTLLEPFTTRDTVAVETPASLASSFDPEGPFAPEIKLVVISLLPDESISHLLGSPPLINRSVRPFP
jgi:hypothetical protein